MHRTIEISIAPSHADALVNRLRTLNGVVGLAHHRGASVMPPGDVVSIHALNSATDDVLKIVAASSDSVSVVTAEVASISDPAHQHAIDRDVDEAIWEEIETGLRHQGRLGTNYVALMALGGVIGAAGALAEPAVAAVAYVASAIIAPGFEPIAKLPLGAVLRRAEVFKAGLISTVVGYGMLIATAFVTCLVLVALDAADLDMFLSGDALKHTIDPDAFVLSIAMAGAVAGVIIQAAYRRTVIAGALVALRLIEIAAVIGLALAFGRFDLAWQAVLRLGVDIAFVFVAGVVVFGLKQLFVHRRAPLH
jgi:Domain of unknown function (DUF389)